MNHLFCHLKDSDPRRVWRTCEKYLASEIYQRKPKKEICGPGQGGRCVSSCGGVLRKAIYRDRLSIHKIVGDNWHVLPYNDCQIIIEMGLMEERT